MLRTLILKLTHRTWNRQISRILCRACGERLITSEQLHILSAAFDPTQNHIVYGPRVPYGFKGKRGVLCCGMTKQKPRSGN
jgi:hypothetical protein